MYLIPAHVCVQISNNYISNTDFVRRVKMAFQESRVLQACLGTRWKPIHYWVASIICFFSHRKSQCQRLLHNFLAGLTLLLVLITSCFSGTSWSNGTPGSSRFHRGSCKCLDDYSRKKHYKWGNYTYALSYILDLGPVHTSTQPHPKRCRFEKSLRKHGVVSRNTCVHTTQNAVVHMPGQYVTLWRRHTNTLKPEKKPWSMRIKACSLPLLLLLLWP